MSPDDRTPPARRGGPDPGTLMALIALAISGLSFYRGYIYTKQDLEVTVTEVSYMTNQGGVYMGIAFSNGGNRDAAVLRIEPALWSNAKNGKAEWKPLVEPVDPQIPLVAPRTPLVVKSGGVEVLRLSTLLNAGTLLVSNVTALGTLASVSVSSGANFSLGANQTVGALSGAGNALLNGKTLMSSRMHGSEEALATAGCQHLRTAERPRVLVGGLGMGFTLRAALDMLPVQAVVTVAELVPAVVEWNRGPLSPLAGHPLKVPAPPRSEN